MITAFILKLLLTTYVACFIFYNLVAFLISSFYRKKFNQPSPQSGFLIAALFALLYLGSLFAFSGEEGSRSKLMVIFLFCSCLASAGSSLALYFTMHRKRK
jgi:4-hydroxybenzoate polyprenyltransferase